jgi:hypothetical protein
MADSASFAGSFDFCGIFAITNVASSLRRTKVAARTVTSPSHFLGPRDERGIRCAPEPLWAAGPGAFSSYRLGNTMKTAAKPQNFIIVNFVNLCGTGAFAVRARLPGFALSLATMGR